MLELNRGGRAAVQTEMVEFIASTFPSPKKLKIWSFHVVVVRDGKEVYKLFKWGQRGRAFRALVL